MQRLHSGVSSIQFAELVAPRRMKPTPRHVPRLEIGDVDVNIRRVIDCQGPRLGLKVYSGTEIFCHLAFCST